MANLKEVKNRIKSVSSTQQITKAMKMVAAAKLRRAQDRIIQLRPYAKQLKKVMENISSSIDSDNFENPYTIEREVRNVLLIVVTSDRGLCGAFNSNVFKHTINLIANEYSSIASDGGLFIMPIGKRSYEYFSKRGYQVIDKYVDLFLHLNFDDARTAAAEVIEGFVSERFDKVEIVYNEFKNVATQILKNEQLLPVVSVDGNDGISNSETDYIFEPSQNLIFKEIVPKSVNIQFYKAILESNAAENGARMTAMDQATDNAEELLKELKLTYNRTRQAAITKEILEIVGGAEALAQGS